MTRKPRPADMIFGILLVALMSSLMVFGLNECGRAQRDLEHALSQVK